MDIMRWLRSKIPCTHGHGSCGRCGLAWCQLDYRYHATRYSDSSSVFPLCEDCWGVLTPTERLPYYRQLLASWRDGTYTAADMERDWPLVERAVLTEEGRDALGHRQEKDATG